ncbi:hypothetical protein K1728_06505 [Weissella confusa]|uniref:hypothetical protein n=1 Tax=Weissella confusa TaxID=1583 RepID=UPI001C6FB04D|nr:hypothetical protein [Weissella confusa]QYU56842.1 hypothetical protein K1728_06505 [Weissella confusa]
MPLANEFKVQEYFWEPPVSNFKDPKLKQKTAPYFLGYRGMTKGPEAYIISNTSSETGGLIYSDLLLLDGAAIANLPMDLSNMIVEDAGRVFTGLEMGTSISFKSYSYRVSTLHQQKNWAARRDRLQHQLSTTTDTQRQRQIKARLAMIDNELYKQKQLEKNVWSREYLMVPFANSVAELTELIATLESFGNGEGTKPFRFSKLTRQQKKERLFALNNPTQYMDDDEEIYDE